MARQQEQFYPLTESELSTVSQVLKAAELKVYLWLSIQMPFPDSAPIEIDTERIAESLGLHRRTIQIALNKLSELGLFGWEAVRAKIWRFSFRDASRSPVRQENNRSRSTDRQSDPQIAKAIHRS
ncbi:hypothetical protein, partial [Baaleninema sp.]|uniref:hypothetical protein n=1 Tax=Baaleninema sp. TaxID=3101197 RepID=UPI003CFEB7C3